MWPPCDSPPASTQAIIPSVSVNRPLTDRAGGGQITIVFPPIDLCKYWSSLEVWVKISTSCSRVEAFYLWVSHFWPKERAETEGSITEWQSGRNICLVCILVIWKRSAFSVIVSPCVGPVPDRPAVSSRDKPRPGQTRPLPVKETPAGRELRG